MGSKYTAEQLAPLVAQGVSVAQVLRALGLRQVGSIHTHIARLIRKYGLDTSHFTGSATNAGLGHRGDRTSKPGRRSWSFTTRTIGNMRSGYAEPSWSMVAHTAVPLVVRVLFGKGKNYDFKWTM